RWSSGWQSCRDRLSADATLLRSAASFRHGIVLPPEEVEPTFADIRGLTNMGVPANSEDPWAGATGGIGWDHEPAENAALGEALERYAAAAFAFPEQPRSGLSRHECLGADEF